MMVQLTKANIYVLFILILLPSTLAISSWFNNYSKKLHRILEYGPVTVSMYTQWMTKIPQHDFDRFKSQNKIPVFLARIAFTMCMQNPKCISFLETYDIHTYEDFTKQIMQWYFTEGGFQVEFHVYSVELLLDVAYSFTSGFKLCIAEKPSLDFFTVPRICVSSW